MRDLIHGVASSEYLRTANKTIPYRSSKPAENTAMSKSGGGQPISLITDPAFRQISINTRRTARDDEESSPIHPQPLREYPGIVESLHGSGLGQKRS